MSDQHSPHVLGCGGDPIVRTPHLDGLAQRGIYFENTYSAAPVCVPSRMSFMTTQYPSDIEVWTNSCLLDSQIPTWAHALSLGGYETTLCGRMHFIGPDQHHGFQHRLVGDVSGAMVPGFSWNGLFEGKIPLEACGQSSPTHGRGAVGPGQSTYMAYDNAVSQRACEYLKSREQTGTEQPFCLTVGMLLPHNPYVCPRPLFDEYMDKVSLPASEALNSVHPAIAKLRRDRGTETIAPEQSRRARAAYYGLTTYLDERIGDILTALAATSFAENTIVVYTSDHGEMAGEHGIWWKENFYEGACRVPMIWSWPGHFGEGARQSRISSLLDIGPTCIDLTGAPALPLSRGSSLQETLRANENTGYGNRPTFAETYAPEQRPARMIRSGPWKLNRYHGYAAPQLFNLEDDPGEQNDLGRDERFAAIRDKLLEQVEQEWDAERIERIVAQRQMTAQWQQEIGCSKSDLWDVPAGSNKVLGDVLLPSREDAGPSSNPVII